ncbi:MAG: hypothetical protein EA381_06875 [Planctomycetaceae bacterium]|nr:MAG: hypothetical protein EA381_06875 [Planctomycetaceae bacterium]
MERQPVVDAKATKMRVAQAARFRLKRIVDPSAWFPGSGEHRRQGPVKSMASRSVTLAAGRWRMRRGAVDF